MGDGTNALSCDDPDWLLNRRGHRSCANHPVDASHLSRGEHWSGDALRSCVAGKARPRRLNSGRYPRSGTSASRGLVRRCPRAALARSCDIETSTRTPRGSIAFAVIGHTSGRKRDGHACRCAASHGDGHKKDEQISHRSIQRRVFNEGSRDLAAALRQPHDHAAVALARAASRIEPITSARIERYDSRLGRRDARQLCSPSAVSTR